MTATPAGGRHGKPWRAAGAAVVLLIAMVGSGMVGAALKTAPAPRPPQPLAQARPEATATGPAIADMPATDEADAEASGAAVTDAPSTEAPDTGLPRSAPATITIPRIGVDASIMSLGTNPDGTIQVPPLEQAHLAGWYAPGPSPGEVGNAVIVGHVDSAKIGPAVFFYLGSLQPGDDISVAREDGRSVTFTVESVKAYPKTEFPTELVYGPNDRAGLRVVTCGGTFNREARSYRDNIVVFATIAE